MRDLEARERALADREEAVAEGRAAVAGETADAAEQRRQAAKLRRDLEGERREVERLRGEAEEAASAAEQRVRAKARALIIACDCQKGSILSCFSVIARRACDPTISHRLSLFLRGLDKNNLDLITNQPTQVKRLEEAEAKVRAAQAELKARQADAKREDDSLARQLRALEVCLFFLGVGGEVGKKRDRIE